MIMALRFDLRSCVHAVVFNFCSCKVTTFLIHFTFVEILCSYIKFQRRFNTHTRSEGGGSSWNLVGLHSSFMLFSAQSHAKYLYRIMCDWSLKQFVNKMK